MKVLNRCGALLLMLCVLLCCLVPAFAEAQKPVALPGSNVGYLFDEATATMVIVLTHGAKSGEIGDNTADGALIPDADRVKHVEIAPWICAIGARAFADFNNLETIAIPQTVREIGADAFQNCGAFTVTFAGTREQWNEIRFGERNDWAETAAVRFPNGEPDPAEPGSGPVTEPEPEPLCRWCNRTHTDGFFQKIVAWFHSVLARLFKR